MCFKTNSKRKARLLCKRYNYPEESIYRLRRREWVVEPAKGRAKVEEMFWDSVTALSIRALKSIKDEGGAQLYTVEVY